MVQLRLAAALARNFGLSVTSSASSARSSALPLPATSARNTLATLQFLDAGRNPFERIARSHFAGLDHAEIPAAACCPDDGRHHPLVAEAVFDLPARLARLAHLDQRPGRPGAEAEAVADVDHVFGKPRNGKVRPETARFCQRGMIADFAAPEHMIIERIKVQRHFRTPMNAAVSLFVGGEAIGKHLHRTFCAGAS